MHTHGRHSADRAHQRTTTFRGRPLTTPILIVVLLLAAAGCATEPAVQSVAPSPSTTEPVGATGGRAPTTTLDRPSGRADEPAGTEPVADEFDIDHPPTDTEVLDAAEPEPLEAGSPEAVISEITTQLDGAALGDGGPPLLDRLPPIDTGPSGQVISVRDGRSINEVGEPDQLDEAAALACGNVEIALTALDDGATTKAIDRLQSASTSAGDSSVAAVNQWATVLEQSVTGLRQLGPSQTDASPLLAFLSTCAQGGYEL